MFGLSKKEVKKQSNTLLICVDGRSIGVCLYESVSKNDLFTQRKIHIQGQSVRSLESVLEESLYAVKHYQNSTIDTIRVVLEEPWIKETISSVKEKRTKAFEINQKFLDELGTKEFERAKDTNPGSRALGHTVEHVTLNGYNYIDPIGKITEQVEIALTSFIADNEFIALLDKHIKDIFPLAKTDYFAGNKLFIESNHALSNVSGIYTTLLSTDTLLRVYNKSIITEKVNLSFGYHDFVALCINKWNMDIFEVENWLTLFLDKKLDTVTMARIDSDLRNIFNIFTDKLQLIANSTAIFNLERPYVIIGSFGLWNRLFMYALCNAYFGEIIIHSDRLSVNILEAQNNLGDSLLSVYKKMF